MLRESLMPINSAISSIRPKKIAMPTRPSRKISALSPRALNKVAYSIEGRVSTRIKPVMDLPVGQSMALKRVANGMCTSKRFAGSGTCPASTLVLAFSPDKLTISREFPVLTHRLSLSLSGTEEDLPVRGEVLDVAGDSGFVAQPTGIVYT